MIDVITDPKIATAMVTPMLGEAGFYKVRQSRQGAKLVTQITLLAGGLKLIASGEGTFNCYSLGFVLGNRLWKGCFVSSITLARSGTLIVFEDGSNVRFVIDGKPDCQRLVSWQVYDCSTPICLEDLCPSWAHPSELGDRIAA